MDWLILMRKSTSRSNPEFKDLAYAVTISSYGPAVVPASRPGKEPQIVEVTPNNVVEHRTQKMQEPQVALRVDHGWLAGSNRGEWGGELTYVDDFDPAQQVLNENVEDVYLLGKDIVSVTGLAHMMSNHGMIYKVNRGMDGDCLACAPGCP